LVVEEYFAGSTRAWGVFKDRFGAVRRQFVVDMTGTWNGRELVLTEDFAYADGETGQRTWRIVKRDEHTYEGTADDVIGTAVGRVFGNAVNWRYTVDLKVGDGTWRVKFDDWMFLQGDGVMINRAWVSKWGVHIGSATIAFAKLNAPADAVMNDEGEAAASGGSTARTADTASASAASSAVGET